MSARRYAPAARAVADILPVVLAQHGLQLEFSRWILTEYGGQGWLFTQAVPSVQGPDLEAYSSPALLNAISEALNGKRVLAFTEGKMLRYSIRLTEQSLLPNAIQFPGFQDGLLQLGINSGGEAIAVPISEFEPLLLVGPAEQGRINLLSLIAHQALENDYIVALIGRRHLPHIGDQISLQLPGDDILAGSLSLLDVAYEELNRRLGRHKPQGETKEDVGSALFQGIPVATESHKQVLILIDELDPLLDHTGGSDGPVGYALKTIAREGPAAGVHLVIGDELADRLDYELLSLMPWKICFKLKSRGASRRILGLAGAERLTISNRALSEPWGAIQIYHFEAPLVPMSMGSFT